MSTQIKSYSLPFKAILAVDFDLTICMSEYPELGSERENAGIILRKLVHEGYGIVINTCREGIALANAIKWMHENNIPYHFVNCNFPHLISLFGADCRKISADLYIDDKGLGGLPEWKQVYEIIANKFNV
jgi:hypothetical protein